MAGRKQHQSRLNLEYPATSFTWGMLKLHLGLVLLLKFSYRKQNVRVSKFGFNMQDTLKRWLCPALCVKTLRIVKIRKYGKLPSRLVFEIFTCRLGLFRSVAVLRIFLV